MDVEESQTDLESEPNPGLTVHPVYAKEKREKHRDSFLLVREHKEIGSEEAVRTKKHVNQKEAQ